MPHIHEKIDFTSSIYIVHNDKILLHLHKKLKIWIGVGGHIELDEDPNQTAIREAKEEAGLDVTLIDTYGTKNEFKDYGEHRSLIVPAFLDIHSISGTHQHIDMVYFAKSDTNETNPEEGIILKWFTKEELLKNEDGLIAEKIINYGIKALEAAGK